MGTAASRADEGRGARSVRALIVVVTLRGGLALGVAPRAWRSGGGRRQTLRHAADGDKGMLKIAFQGEHGAYSEEAAYQHFGASIETLPLPSFEAVFSAVESGLASYGMLPMENSQAGSINKSHDLLLEYDLRVHGETTLRVRHALMALPAEAGKETVPLTTVRSHPQALAQCERYILANALQIEAGADTAGSAREIADGQIRGVGAICSVLAASRYGLEVVAYGIEDYEYNFTRFFVLGKGDAATPTKIPKTSVAFAVVDKPGALCAALDEFGKRKVNLIKLESRPRRRTVAPGFNYVFFADFEGSLTDEPCSEAIMGLLGSCAFVKLLGSFEAAPPAASSLSEGATLDPTLMQI
ncbi:hypothetical protein M885DRAFT_505411 [Pelagophyceae sp. CCMP2097]|nr:hypothetical protein M885DRAFT_505411 [Pelagophyceae sp. CCMP2097]|mmetsp:Transcript_30613/g.105812  ORF Transcript_30613/g.105812 Transcript_30613/m.105812 type:complete len:356 (-) Transcript_30613:1031-2098(-)